MIKRRALLVLAICIVLLFGSTMRGEEIASEKLIGIKYFPGDDDENVYYKSPPQMVIDQKGNIYSFFRNEHFIFKTDKAGRFIKRISQKGQGPGDLFRPWKMKIKGDKLFVLDAIAMSVFSLEGTFIRKFRIFNRVFNFDLFQDKIILLDISKDSLMVMCDLTGKRIKTFGVKYKPDFSKFKTGDKYFVEECLNEGTVICSEENIFFVSYLFGDVFRYDSKGKLIEKKKLKGIDSSQVKRNIDYFFVNGPKEDDKLGQKINFWPAISDIFYHEGSLYVLDTKQSKNMGQILSFAIKSLSLKKIYCFGLVPGRESEAIAPYFIFPRKTSNGMNFYISMYWNKDNYIALYKTKK